MAPLSSIWVKLLRLLKNHISDGCNFLSYRAQLPDQEHADAITQYFQKALDVLAPFDCSVPLLDQLNEISILIAQEAPTFVILDHVKACATQIQMCLQAFHTSQDTLQSSICFGHRNINGIINDTLHALSRAHMEGNQDVCLMEQVRWVRLNVFTASLFEQMVQMMPKLACPELIEHYQTHVVKHTALMADFQKLRSASQLEKIHSNLIDFQKHIHAKMMALVRSRFREMEDSLGHHNAIVQELGESIHSMRSEAIQDVIDKLVSSQQKDDEQALINDLKVLLGLDSIHIQAQRIPDTQTWEADLPTPYPFLQRMEHLTDRFLDAWEAPLRLRTPGYRITAWLALISQIASLIMMGLGLPVIALAFQGIALLSDLPRVQHKIKRHLRDARQHHRYANDPAQFKLFPDASYLEDKQDEPTPQQALLQVSVIPQPALPYLLACGFMGYRMLNTSLKWVRLLSDVLLDWVLTMQAPLWHSALKSLTHGMLITIIVLNLTRGMCYLIGAIQRLQAGTASSANDHNIRKNRVFLNSMMFGVGLAQAVLSIGMLKAPPMVPWTFVGCWALSVALSVFIERIKYVTSKQPKRPDPDTLDVPSRGYLLLHCFGLSTSTQALRRESTQASFRTQSPVMVAS